MAPASVWPMLLLLLVLLGSLPASTQGETPYEKFLRQHVDYPKTRPDLDGRAYCNLMMQRRGMTIKTCKQFNTFIHENTSVVDAICTTGGTNVNLNYYDSHAYFNITNCEVIGGRGQKPPCSYKGWDNYKRIEVACNNMLLPVHFEKAL